MGGNPLIGYFHFVFHQGIINLLGYLALLKILKKIMIHKEIYIPEAEWLVHMYFALDTFYIDDIMENLYHIGCDGERARRAYENMIADKKNTGFTYSNYRNRESVMVVSKTTSAGEFFNTTVHELTHLASHIANACQYEPTGETIAYIIGDLAKEIYPDISHLLCEECRSASCSH